MDEIKIINRIKNGDRHAMEILINAYYQSVFAYFYCHTASRETSMDLTQEVFIKIIASIEKYENKGKFKSWLFTIAANHLRNHWKYQSIHTVYALEENTVYDDWDDITDNINLQQALLKISNDQRESIILKYYLGFTTKEISRMLGIKEPTIKARIRYGLQKLNQLLRGDHGGQKK